MSRTICRSLASIMLRFHSDVRRVLVRVLGSKSGRSSADVLGQFAAQCPISACPLRRRTRQCPQGRSEICQAHIHGAQSFHLPAYRSHFFALDWHVGFAVFHIQFFYRVSCCVTGVLQTFCFQLHVVPSTRRPRRSSQ